MSSEEEYIEGTKGPVFRNGWPKSAEIKKYVGGCHCGKFRYEFEFPSLDTSPVIQCNCTSCSQKGGIMTHPPLSRFSLTKGTLDELSKYQFNKRVVTHYFCPVCGSQMFAFAPVYGCAAVNLNTVDEIDTSKLNIKKVDNRSRDIQV